MHARETRWEKANQARLTTQWQTEMYKVTYEKYAAYPGPVHKTAAASTPSTTGNTNTTPAASGSGGYRE